MKPSMCGRSLQQRLVYIGNQGLSLLFMKMTSFNHLDTHLFKLVLLFYVISNVKHILKSVGILTMNSFKKGLSTN